MTKIRFQRPPVKLHVTLERYYGETTQKLRDDINETYEGIYCAIQTALYTSTQLFGLYSFDITQAIDNTERICDYNLADVLLLDHALSAEETDFVLEGMVLMVTDIYVAINTYAQYLLKDGYDVEDLADLIGETDWEIFPESSTNLDTSEEISLVIDQSVSEWMNKNRRQP